MVSRIVMQVLVIVATCIALPLAVYTIVRLHDKLAKNSGALWRSKYESFRFERNLVFIGVNLMLLLPFGLGGPWIQWCHGLVCTVLGNSHASDSTRLECWEVAAVLWSLVYCFAFLQFKVPTMYRALDPNDQPRVNRIIKNATITTPLLGIVALILFALPAVVDFVSRGAGHPLELPNLKGANRLIAETLVIVWFFKVDWTMSRSMFVQQGDQAVFKNILWIVDVPGVVGFITLSAFVGMRIVFAGYDNQLSLVGFISGASAVNLLIVNCTFTILLIREVVVK